MTARIADRRRHDPGDRNGFTLLELLVVVSIVSVLTTVAGLSVSLGRPAPDSDAARFAALFDRVRYGAVAEGRVAGLQLTGAQAQEMRREGDAWVPEGPPVVWQGPVGIDGTRLIVIWPSDQSDPVQVDFPRDGGPAVRCTAPGVGGVSCSG